MLSEEDAAAIINATGAINRIDFKKGGKDAGIKKNVNLHMLRYSYANHLLESGTGLRHRQVLLGHNSPMTTKVYTHVSRQELGKIISPFGKLNINHKKEKK